MSLLNGSPASVKTLSGFLAHQCTGAIRSLLRASGSGPWLSDDLALVRCIREGALPADSPPASPTVGGFSPFSHTSTLSLAKVIRLRH